MLGITASELRDDSVVNTLMRELLSANNVAARDDFRLSAMLSSDVLGTLGLQDVQDDDALGTLMAASGSFPCSQDARDDEALDHLVYDDDPIVPSFGLGSIQDAAFGLAASLRMGTNGYNDVDLCRPVGGYSTTAAPGILDGAILHRQWPSYSDKVAVPSLSRHWPPNEDHLDTGVPSDDDLLESLMPKPLHAKRQTAAPLRLDTPRDEHVGVPSDDELLDSLLPSAMAGKRETRQLHVTFRSPSKATVLADEQSPRSLRAESDQVDSAIGEVPSSLPDEFSSLESVCREKKVNVDQQVEVPDAIPPGLITDEIGVLMHSTLLQMHVVKQSRWIFVGPRERWRLHGLSQLSIQALEHVGGGGDSNLVHAAQATDIGTWYPEMISPLKGQERSMFSKDDSARSKSKRPRAALDPAVSMLTRAAAEWGFGTEGPIFDRVARVGGTILLLVCGDALDTFQHSRALPEARRRNHLRVDSSGDPGKRTSVRVASPTLLKHIVAALSQDLTLLADVVLASGEVLKCNWRMMPKISAGLVATPAELSTMKLPITMWFDTCPGLPVAQVAPVPEVFEPSPQVTVAAIHWPPTAGMRVQRWGSEPGDCDGSIICAGRTNYALVRWDCDCEYEQVHVSDLKELDDTVEFLARVQKFRLRNSDGDAAGPKRGHPTAAKFKHRAKQKAAENAPSWRLFMATSPDAEDGDCGNVGNLQVCELINGDVHLGGETIAMLGQPMSVPSNVLQRCAEAGGDSPTALLIVGPKPANMAQLLSVPGCKQPADDLSWNAARASTDESIRFRIGDAVLVDPDALPSHARLRPQAGRWLQTPRRPPLLKARVAEVSGRRDVGVRIQGQDDILWVQGARVYLAGSR